MFYQELKSQANIAFSFNHFKPIVQYTRHKFYHQSLYVPAYTVYPCVPHNSYNKQRLSLFVSISVGLSLGRTHVSSQVWI
jgi:hypothetical protein